MGQDEFDRVMAVAFKAASEINRFRAIRYDAVREAGAVSDIVSDTEGVSEAGMLKMAIAGVDDAYAEAGDKIKQAIIEFDRAVSGTPDVNTEY